MSTILPFRQVAQKTNQLKERFKYPFPFLNGRPPHTWRDILKDKKVLHFGSGDINPVPSSNNQMLLDLSSLLITVDDDKETGADYNYLKEVPDRDIDTVISEHVLEHIAMENIEGVFTSIYNMLKPGGKFLFTVPNILSYGVWFTCFDHRNHAEAVEFAAIASSVCDFEVKDIFRWTKEKQTNKILKWQQDNNQLELFLLKFMWEQYSLDAAQFVTVLLEKPSDVEEQNNG